jgi:Secretion system C-terminal sorting domain
MKRTILLFFVCFIASNAILAAIKFVTPAGAGAMDGTSWANAAPGSSLQSMITASAANDQVWVAKGTYYPTSTTDRTVSFSMKNGVSIYGGFAGTETLLTQRVLTCGQESILSGAIGGSGTGDNSYHVISNSSGITNTALLDGFTIRDANDNRAATLTDGLGGGIYNNGSEAGGACSPTLRNCIIINNFAAYGAGIFNNGYNGGNSSPVIVNCIIAGNTAYIGGGGIDNFGLAGNASPTIGNSIIYNNTAAQRAGAMYCWGGNNGNASPTVQNCAFVNNSAVDGGGIVADRLNASSGSSGTSNPIITNSIFWGNTATGTGKQFFTLGAATFTATYSIIDLTGQTAPHTISGAGTGNISTDPQFVNVSNAIGADGCWFGSDDGLRLKNTSPAINAGSNTNASEKDISGNVRIVGSTIDMGPYEGEAEEPVVTGVNEEHWLPIRIYPNPTTHQLHVLHVGDGDISLIDIMGKTLFTKKSTEPHEVIDVAHLSQGLYILVISGAGRIEKIKWTKN